MSTLYVLGGCLHHVHHLSSQHLLPGAAAAVPQKLEPGFPVGSVQRWPQLWPPRDAQALHDVVTARHLNTDFSKIQQLSAERCIWFCTFPFGKSPSKGKTPLAWRKPQHENQNFHITGTSWISFMGSTANCQNIVGSSFARGMQWMKGFALTKALLLALQWGYFYTTTLLSLRFTQFALLNIPRTVYGGAG